LKKEEEVSQVAQTTPQKRESIKKEEPVVVSEKRESIKKEEPVASINATPEKRDSISKQIIESEKKEEHKILPMDIDVTQQVQPEENELKPVRCQAPMRKISEKNDEPIEIHDTKIDPLPTLATEHSQTTPLLEIRKNKNKLIYMLFLPFFS
jgi:hypothetical protein